jgi:hypothetical protein
LTPFFILVGADACSIPAISARSLAWELGGYDLVIWIAIGASCAGLIALLAAVRFSKCG